MQQIQDFVTNLWNGDKQQLSQKQLYGLQRIQQRVKQRIETNDMNPMYREYFHFTTNVNEDIPIWINTSAMPNPSRIAQAGASKKMLDPSEIDCKNRKIELDMYGRKVDPNTLKLWNCPGDDVNIALQRDQYTFRQTFDGNTNYFMPIPKGLDGA